MKTIESTLLVELADQWLEEVERIEDSLRDNDCASAAVASGIESVRACAKELKEVAATGKLP